MSTDTASQKPPRGRILAIAGILVVIVLPFLIALVTALAGQRYLGFEYNSDDHMVYAAWMRQAMDGRFMFDNRFTTDPQPGLTIHLYFLALGFLAKLLGIPLAATVGRLVCAAFFLVLLGRLIKRLEFEPRLEGLSFFLVAFGGGIGFLFWQMFGTTFTKPFSESVTGFLNNQLPIDVWQPEAFVFPSMLTNGLFMVSLCLIMVAYLCFLSAKNTWRAVGIGFVAVGILMNVHSYDVLTLALVMIGFLAAEFAKKQATAGWIVRALVIGAGAILPALWFVHVLQNDPVFQSRAATETYSPNFRAVFVGYLPLIVLGLTALGFKAKGDKRRLAGGGIYVVLLVALIGLAGGHTQGYFMGMPAWVVVFGAAVAATTLSADENPTWNLIVSWAMIGLIAIYFPGLFQRKLTMGLSIPWAILAAYGLWELVAKAPSESTRKLCVAAGSILACATSLLWLTRDLSFIRDDVANTTRHPVFLDPDLVKVIDLLNQTPGKKVVIALPGSGNPSADSDGHPIPDSFGSPILPDIAPIITGLTGAYSYAGHWSETPDYLKRTGDVYKFLLNAPFNSVHEVMNDQERHEFEQRTGANYAVIPSKDRGLPITPPNQLGQVVYAGPVWTLVKLG